MMRAHAIAIWSVAVFVLASIESAEAGPPRDTMVDDVFRETQREARRAIHYELNKGLVLESEDNEIGAWIGFRMQPRYSTDPGTPTSVVDLPDETGDFFMKRARFKGEVSLFGESIVSYTEYDFPSERLLTVRGTFFLNEDVNVRLGQWKSPYNRERVDSSGKQQFTERSISTYWFTIDRQLGAAVNARLWKGRPADSSLWLGVLSGTGRGGEWVAGEHLWLARYQWNFTRRVLGFSQSDIKRRKKPAGSIALAAVAGETAFTRFSSSGGGQLPGFDGGTFPGRFRLRQAMLETAYQYCGFSWQQELHIKDIWDTENRDRRTLLGGYAQAGYFPCGLWRWVPRPLELAIRAAFVDPDLDESSDHQYEYAIGANWFFNGHDNKLTADFSILNFDDEALGNERDYRFRVQWDVSF